MPTMTDQPTRRLPDDDCPAGAPPLVPAPPPPGWQWPLSTLALGLQGLIGALGLAVLGLRAGGDTQTLGHAAAGGLGLLAAGAVGGYMLALPLLSTLRKRYPPTWRGATIRARIAPAALAWIGGSLVLFLGQAAALSASLAGRGPAAPDLNAWMPATLCCISAAAGIAVTVQIRWLATHRPATD
jgi:hypothetical protein